ncbi:MAG: hypothetical protein KC464_06095 [Myxococcales bacterium]|nr:hypothetical protein [Myxococcales bacterium]
MNELTDVAGTWWSFAHANSTLVGVVVGALAAAAVVFTATRILGRPRRRR